MSHGRHNSFSNRRFPGRVEAIALEGSPMTGMSTNTSEFPVTYADEWNRALALASFVHRR